MMITVITIISVTHPGHRRSGGNMEEVHGR